MGDSNSFVTLTQGIFHLHKNPSIRMLPHKTILDKMIQVCLDIHLDDKEIARFFWMIST